MVLGIILIDTDGFGVFEHFLAEFDDFGVSRNELYESIEKLSSNGSLTYKTIKIEKLKIDDKISLILISPENKPLNDGIKANMHSIASKVAYGDKLAIQQILQMKSEIY